MKIVGKKVLTDSLETRIVQIEVVSASIVQKVKAGQFIVLMVSPEGERVPLTVVDADKVKNTITLIFQEAGLTTKLLGKLNVGDSLFALAGPLGHATDIHNYGKVILVGGGLGIAEIYPVAKAFSAKGARLPPACWTDRDGQGSASGGKKAGNQLSTILGVRTKDLLILEQELKEISEEFYVTTDDGSYGKKGFVTDILKDLLRSAPSAMRYALIYAVGPIPMMRKVAETTKPFNVKTLVSLNALMVDATGMCGCCRVSVGDQTKFSCVDGPEFDAHLVDWDELIKRNNIYKDKEQHICKLYNL